MRVTQPLGITSNILRIAWQNRKMAPSTLKRVASTDRDISPPPPKRKVPASATATNVANFFKPASERSKEPERVTFNIVHDSVLVARYNKEDDALRLIDKAKHRIAAFDFDDTLVTTASGNRFSRDAQDWKWWHASVPDKLKRLHEDGVHVVIMSNQGAVRLRPDPKTVKGDMKSLNNFKGKVTSVLTRLDLPITLHAATGHDLYRKPRAGMWQVLLNGLRLDASEVDHEQSIFVGDAAGRDGDKARGIRKDHSSSDRDLATNIAIPFSTPEEYFLNEAPRPFTRVFEPSDYLHSGKQDILFTKQNDVDIVLFCGSPGSGKSTFYWTYLQPLSYERANQDLLKTRDRCMAVARQCIEAGKAVAVDNTNADVETRGSWIALARKLKVPIRLVHFTSPAKLCEHNDTVRALSGKIMNPEDRKMLPKMAFSGFTSRYQAPSVAEGFTDITRVDFKFAGSEEQENIWRKYWIS
ncbi:hypothetical protein AMS68_003466 [Peltaster fructicola]|uniref:Polynucleotide kinase 3'-phosphatase n=1 Tax=Peltaster fructicola TaxID=286661 RepID=A0A6H0XTK2_9PEZI|nr:hypothetical protein AMS68_003466 [Peltaster fructicola]